MFCFLIIGSATGKPDEPVLSSRAESSVMEESASVVDNMDKILSSFRVSFN